MASLGLMFFAVCDVVNDVGVVHNLVHIVCVAAVIGVIVAFGC